MVTTEKRVGRLSFFGRTADALTRKVIDVRNIRVSVEETSTTPLYKQDGFFAIADLEHTALDYRISIESFSYQTKTVLKSLPGPEHEELAYDGEDEFFIVINSTDSGESTVSFAKIPFVPFIAKGSKVIGEIDFTTELADDLGGDDVVLAKLVDLGNLDSGQLLRFVRSNHLLLKPGPYYPFSSDMKIAALKVVKDTAGDPPIEAAKITITKVNDKPIATTSVGMLAIKTVVLESGPQPKIEIMGTEEDIQVYTNARGDAVFYYPLGSQVNELTMTVVRGGFVTKTRVVSLMAGQRTFEKIRLTPV